MGDRGQQVHSQLEHLQAKYVGTGHADTTKFDWAVNQHRDSYVLYVGMDSLSKYFKEVGLPIGSVQYDSWW